MSEVEEPYRVIKRLVPVRVRLTTGRQIAALVKCAEQAEHHAGRERVRDLLNAREPMIPLWNEVSQTSTLVNKRFIELVELVEPDSSDAPDFATPRQVTLLLSSESGLRGSLRIATPPGHERTLDFLNEGDRFFYLETETGVQVVNLDHVVTVTDLEPRPMTVPPVAHS
jgi:hypothetical protein